MNKSDAQVLRDAADLIEKGGLHKGSYAADRSGFSRMAFDPRAVAFCSVGAMVRAIGKGGHPDHPNHDYDTVQFERCRLRIMGVLRRRATPPALTPVNVATWSDAPRTTAAEVVEVMREAMQEAADPMY